MPDVKSSSPSNFGDVAAFHHKFELPQADEPTLLIGELLDFRVKFMQEELDEFVEAHANKRLDLAFDALIDLSYVVLGTAFLMNLPWQAGWEEVHQANMQKVRAKRASDSTRNSTFDVIKPVGWTAPDIQRVLYRYERLLQDRASQAEAAL